jgi:hypothetical protein
MNTLYLSSIGISDGGCGLHWLGSILDRSKEILYSTAFRPALGVKRPESKSRMVGLTFHSHIHLQGVVKR